MEIKPKPFVHHGSITHTLLSISSIFACVFLSLWHIFNHSSLGICFTGVFTFIWGLFFNWNNEK